MVSHSQTILLDLLRESLFGDEPSYPETINWEEVLSEAKAQTVLGLISPVIPIHDVGIEQSKATYIRVMYEQDRVVRILDSASIPCVIIKGSSASVYYPMPFLRTMGDVDVLVQRHRFEEASSLLSENGYQCIPCDEENGQLSDESRHKGYLMNGVEIELHHHFNSPGFDVDSIIEEAIERREYRMLNGYTFPVLPDIENGLVLLGHIYQHLRNNTLGLRQIIDWEMFFHSVDNTVIQIENLNSLADRAGLLKLAICVTLMCNQYLGLSKTFPLCDGVDKDLPSELIEVVLANGNFGRREDLTELSDVRHFRRATYSIKKNGFFNYFTSVGVSTWKYGKNHKGLIPLAFLYGLFRQLGIGVKSLFMNRGVGNQINEGKKRFELYKKLDIKFDNDK